MSSSDILERPDVRDADTGNANEVFHYVRKNKIAESAVMGTMVEALTAGGLLRHMQLLFVPVSVGIMVARDEPPHPLRRRPRVDPNFLQFVPSAHERS